MKSLKQFVDLLLNKCISENTQCFSKPIGVNSKKIKSAFTIILIKPISNLVDTCSVNVVDFYQQRLLFE